MLKYDAKLQGGPYDGLMLQFAVNTTPSSVTLDSHRYYRRINKKDPDGPWEPANLNVIFVYMEKPK